MTVYYNSSTWTNTTAAYCANFETALLAAGWTIIDTIAASPYNKVLRCPDIQAGSGVYFMVHIRDVGSVGIATMIDYDTTTHTDILPSGNVGGGGLGLPSAPSPGHIYCTQFGVFWNVYDTLRNLGFFFGLPRTSQVQGKTDGVCKTTGSMAIGTTTISTNVDLTGRLYVGQAVMIQNFAHSSASANASNREIVKITAVGASSLTFTATTKAYDSGAKIGPPDMMWVVGPSLSSQANVYNGSGVWSAAVQCVSMANTTFNTQNTISISAGIQLAVGPVTALNLGFTQGMGAASYTPSIFSGISGDAAAACYIFGMIMAAVPVTASVPPVGTLYTDGTDVYEQCSSVTPSGGGLLMLAGPTGATPNFATQTRIAAPVPPVSSSGYAVISPPAPTNKFNQGLN